MNLYESVPHLLTDTREISCDGSAHSTAGRFWVKENLHR